MFWVHGLGELGARNLAPGVLVSARYRIYGDRADVDGSEDVVNGPSELLGGRVKNPMRLVFYVRQIRPQITTRNLYVRTVTHCFAGPSAHSS